MTISGRDALITLIRERPVYPPDDQELNATELGKWLMGYLQGQLDAIETISEFMEEQKN